MPTSPTSNYWLKREGTGVAVPYRAPRCHRHFTARADEPPPLMQSVKASLGGLFSQRNVIVRQDPRVLSARFDSAARGLTLRSPSFTADLLAGGVGDKVVAVPGGAPPDTDPLFTLPLEVDNAGVVQPTLWTANTSLAVLLNSGGSLAFSLRFSLWTGPNTVVEADRTYGQLGGFIDQGHQGQAHEVRFVIPLARPPRRAQRPRARVAASPFKLQVSAVYDQRRVSHAFTYVHVPDPREVQVLEAQAAQRVMFQRADLADFAGFGSAQPSLNDLQAVAQAVADPPPQEKPFSPAEAHLYLTDAELGSVQAALIAPTVEAKLLTAQQKLTQLDHSQLDPAIVEKQRLDLTNQVANFKRLRLLANAARNHGANVDDAHVRAALANFTDYDQNKMNLLVERAGGWFLHLGWGITTILRRDAGTGRYYLARLYIAGYLGGTGRSLSVLDAAGNVASFRGVNDALFNYNDGQVRSTAVVKANTAQPATVNLQGAIAVGANPISTELGGVRVPAERVRAGVGRHLWRERLLGLRRLHRRGRPGGDRLLPPRRQRVPALRRRPAVRAQRADPARRRRHHRLPRDQPHDRRDRRAREVQPAPCSSPTASGPVGVNSYEAIFCPRESHLWDAHAGQLPRGYNAVGVAFGANGQEPSFVGAYGQRSFSINSLIRTINGGQGSALVAREALFDAQRHVYATVPEVFNAFDPDLPRPWQAFLREAHDQTQTQLAMKNAEDGTAFYRIRERVVAQRTVFSLDEVGRRLYNAMRQHAKCKPLPEADCIVIGDGALRWLDHR
jgi:hypothetical protein